MAKKYGWRRGAEIGLWYGATFFHLLDSVPGLFLYGVDDWRPNIMKLPRNEDQRENRRLVLERIGESQYINRCVILEMESLKAASAIRDASLDFVFIDADHSFKAVCADILAWSPKVKAGGFITGHDYDWPSVKGAVDELLPGIEVCSDYVWTHRKEAV